MFTMTRILRTTTIAALGMIVIAVSYGHADEPAEKFAYEVTAVSGSSSSSIRPPILSSWSVRLRHRGRRCALVRGLRQR